MALYSSYTDEQLLALLKGGDEAAFTELYDRHWERMSAYVLKVIQSPDDAKDIVQEVFVSIWKRREEIIVSGPLIAYLLKSVRNLSIRYIERNITQHRFLDRLTEHTRQLDLTAVNSIELDELEKAVDAAIAKLPPKMQEVYRLSRYENLSYRDIATRLGIAETTVKKQVSNALKNIRSELGGLSATAIIYQLFLLH